MGESFCLGGWWLMVMGWRENASNPLITWLAHFSCHFGWNIRFWPIRKTKCTHTQTHERKLNGKIEIVYPRSIVCTQHWLCSPLLNCVWFAEARHDSNLNVETICVQRAKSSHWHNPVHSTPFNTIPNTKYKHLTCHTVAIAAAHSVLSPFWLTF